MSERFVRGWSVSPAKLHAVVGTGKMRPGAVLAHEANAGCLEDVLMTLGEGDPTEGRELAERALAAIFEGPLRAKGAYAYARVTELVLNVVGTAMGKGATIEMSVSSYVEAEHRGSWIPLLKAMKLPKLAKVWAAPSLSFPWAKGRSKCAWPRWTLVEGPDLAAVATELGTVTRKAVDAIPSALFTEGLVDDSRDELAAGLKRLRTWVEKVRAGKGSALVLLLDGDQ